MSNEESSKKKPAVEKKAPRPPAQSLIDQERGDWEGMGQSRHQPEAPPSSSSIATSTPGASSLAGEKQK
jgi:hypothetical protein